MKKDITYWLKITLPYVKPNNTIALWQFFSTLCIAISLLLMSHYLGQKNGLGWNIIIDVITSLFLVRLFVLQHDCGHGSFTTSSRLNNRIGYCLSIFTHISFVSWRAAHSFHHAHNEKLEVNNIGDIKTLTVEEYNQRSLFAKLRYVIVRFAMVFGVGGCVYMLWYLRISINYSERVKPLGDFNSKIENQKFKKVEKSVYVTNIILLALYSLGIYFLGIQFLVHQLIIILGFSIFVMWFFYVQHQFEDAYKAKIKDWDYVEAALKGSSYYKLPRFLEYLTGSIGFHHIHHLNSRVPNYNLRKCHFDNQKEFENEIQVLTLRTSLKSIFLHLYDEKNKKMISFKENRNSYSS